MLQIEKNSRTRLEMMKEHKKQRMEELKTLTVKDRELCDIMCTTPFSIDKDSVPSLKQLEAYHTYIDDLTKEKVLLMSFVLFFLLKIFVFTITLSCNMSNWLSFQECRRDQFVSVKKEIIVCMNDLEQSPETSFETDVMCEDEEAFCLSDDNIAAIKLLLSQVVFVIIWNYNLVKLML